MSEHLTNSEVIRRQELGLKSHPKNWRSSSSILLKVGSCCFKCIVILLNLFF